MANIEDDPRLRELCERASKEYDHDKLIGLVREINDLLEKGRHRSPGEQEKPTAERAQSKTSPLVWGVVTIDLMAQSAEEWLELYPWIPAART